MSNPIPSQIALTQIQNGTLADGSVVQSNDAAIQAAVNALIVALSGGTNGQYLKATDGSDVVWGNAADLSTSSVQQFTGQIKAPQLVANQIGSAALVGSTASGAPSTGTWTQGAFVIDYTGAIWVCTSAGTPGTWKTVGTVASVFGRTGTVTAQSGDYTAAQVTNAADKSSASEQDFTSVVKAPNVFGTGSLASTSVGIGGTFTPAAGNMSNWFSMLSSGAVTVANPSGAAGGTSVIALMGITYTNNNATSSTPTITWDTSYRFGSLASQPGSVPAGASWTWLFLLNMPSARVICVASVGSWS